MKLDKVLSESNVALKKIDKIVSRIFLYYAAIFGFFFGWYSLALFLFITTGEIPAAFVILLRFFYFLLSFIIGLKITIFLISLFRKYF